MTESRQCGFHFKTPYPRLRSIAWFAAFHHARSYVIRQRLVDDSKHEKLFGIPGLQQKRMQPR
ncbi:hypothetical protein Poly51_48810 [Rubripirellula tenax]|uniref:Uncharacterized protein n=1 Tax=Rubripirellula tenax TaxID=2528015 RepID=A0A5C6ELI4_9BACT|nr:hypothetical protein Poly51_48810 [Rubripirellula tenax]